MRIAIHQPNYLPWPGYFKKMSLCDVFVFLDDVQLNKESYTRRVKIRHPEKTDSSAWLTVPLRKAGMHTLIKDLVIDRSKEWTIHHQSLLEHTYQKAPGWTKNSPWIQEMFRQQENYDFIADMNIFLVKNIAERLGIKCKFVRSGNIPVSGKADDYTYAIVKELGGTTYIRGKGEQRYAKNRAWTNDLSLTVVNIDYMQQIDSDPSGTWRNGYSVIDLFLMSAIDTAGYFG